MEATARSSPFPASRTKTVVRDRCLAGKLRSPANAIDRAVHGPGWRTLAYVQRHALPAFLATGVVMTAGAAAEWHL